jgi:hypothetical protein
LGVIRHAPCSVIFVQLRSFPPPFGPRLPPDA